MAAETCFPEPQDTRVSLPWDVDPGAVWCDEAFPVPINRMTMALYRGLGLLIVNEFEFYRA